MTSSSFRSPAVDALSAGWMWGESGAMQHRDVARASIVLAVAHFLAILAKRGPTRARVAFVGTTA
jgi:hypothetical protein